MATATNEELLREIEFFHDLPDHYLTELAKLCREVEFPANTTIFEEYDRAADVYFIVDGEVSLAVCNANGCRQIAAVARGELVGWSPLVGRARLSDTARSITPVRALVFKGKQLLTFCHENPEFGFAFMQRAAAVLADRLSGTRLQLLELAGVHLPEYPLETD